MLALAVTLLAALYFYGPTILYRMVVRLALRQADVLKEPGSILEQVTQGLAWISFSVVLTAIWIVVQHIFSRSALAPVAITVIDWLNGRSSYRSDSAYLDACLQAFLWQNLQLLVRLYISVAFCSALIVLSIRLARQLQANPFGRLLVRVALITGPPIAEWYILLEGMNMPRGLDTHVDVLTKTGGLYRGEVADFSLEPTGAIRTLTLSDPKRFDRDAYEDRKKTHPYVRSDAYWRPIPGDTFVVLGSDIVNVNVRYVQNPAMPKGPFASLDDQLLVDLFKSVRDQTKQGAASIDGPCLLSVTQRPTRCPRSSSPGSS